MDFKGVLFDFDGVVIDSMHQHYYAWSKAFAEKNITFKKEEFFLLEGQGVGTIARILGEKHGLSEQQSLDMLSVKVRFYYKSVKIQFYEYFLEMLNQLQENDIPMAIVTGGNKERVEKVIEDNLKGYFSAIVTIDDVSNGKPHPEPFIKGAEMLSLKPQKCIVVENAPLGIKAAKAAGCFVIAIKTTLDDKHLSKADFICNSFYEVADKLIGLLTAN